ncbi:hypothetical protein [Stutzerimonas stutzeri]|uniref:hypothetical protein n=1 Tax=Stutzerimonas stutzeri TaxID=316 RepID=UPI00202246F1|nr:hypothetical protein [Stutzerimonas stutzeri]
MARTNDGVYPKAGEPGYLDGLMKESAAKSRAKKAAALAERMAEVEADLKADQDEEPTRGRKPGAAGELVEDAPIDGETIIARQNQVALLSEEQETRVRAVATQMGYQLPADCTDPNLIQRDIVANMRRSVEACLEVGRGLQVLKVACGPGNFIARLDVMGIEPRVAQKFMASASRFASLGSNAALTKALGNQSKLFEMLVLDDEQLEELELTGQTGELTLDDVATMSVKELRKALREARETVSAKERVMADKDAKINQLATELARKPLVETKPLDEQLQELRLEATAKAGAAEAAIAGALHPAIHLLMEHGADAAQRTFAAGLLAQVEQAIVEIRAEYGIDAAPVASAVPAWMRDGADDEVAAALASQQQGA